MTNRLPTPGGDDNDWGGILNSFLSVSLASDGTLNNNVVGTNQIQSNAVTNAQLDTTTQNVISSVANKYVKPSGGIPASDLSPSVQTSISNAATAEQTSQKGVAGGYASLNSNGFIPTSQLASGTASTSVYLRGDGTWEVPPASSGSATLSGDTDVSITSASNGQVLTYNSSSGLWNNQNPQMPSNATTAAPGLVQLSGDLGGSATTPSVSRINGISVTGTPSSGQVLTATGSSAAAWSTPAAVNSSTVASSQQTANYTFALADAGTVVEGTGNSAQTFTIPANISVAFPVGTIIEVFQYGAGQITIAGASAVTLRSDGSKVNTAGQYATIGLRQRATDEWVLSGDLA